MKRLIRAFVLATVVSSALALVSIAAPPASYAADDLVEESLHNDLRRWGPVGDAHGFPHGNGPSWLCQARNPIVLRVVG